MLLWLTEYLTQFHSGFNVFQYLTFRIILGVLTSLFISLLVGPSLIRRLNEYQIGQSVRDDGPESHLSIIGLTGSLRAYGRAVDSGIDSGQYFMLG